MQADMMSEHLERTPMGTYVFEHEGTSIHDPLSSECGRFRYDPQSEGSHSPAEYGFEVEVFEGGAGSAWVRRFKVGEVDVVMHLTDESTSTHEVPLGESVRVEVSRVEAGGAAQPLAVWYQAEGALDDTPPRVVFKAPEDLSSGEMAGAGVSCPNCTKSIVGETDSGCALHMLIQTLRERATKSEGRLLELHAQCDADALWTRLGKVADDLEDGRFLWADCPPPMVLVGAGRQGIMAPGQTRGVGVAGMTFITDMGVNHELVAEDGSKLVLERYGAWQMSHRGKNEVVEVGNDLEALLKKYGVRHEDVILMGPKRDEGGA